MGSSAKAPDALTHFFSLSEPGQFLCAKTWLVKVLHRIRKRAAEMVRISPTRLPPLSMRTHCLIVHRIGAVDLELDLLFRLPLEKQLARIDSMPTLEKVDDLLNAYLRWVDVHKARGLPYLVHARMLERLQPNDYLESRQDAEITEALTPEALEEMRTARPRKE